MVVQGSPSKPAKSWTPLLVLLHSVGRRFDVADVVAAVDDVVDAETLLRVLLTM